MPRGRWKEAEEQFAHEAYAVLIRRDKATRTHSKTELAKMLCDPDVYVDFLKLCIEYDDSADLKNLRKGLMHVVRAMGPTGIAATAGFSRVSLYRMLSKGGNPRLKSLIGLLTALGLRLWVVDEDFIGRRSRFTRLKDQQQLGANISTGHRVTSKRFGGK